MNTEKIINFDDLSDEQIRQLLRDAKATLLKRRATGSSDALRDEKNAEEAGTSKGDRKQKSCGCRHRRGEGRHGRAHPRFPREEHEHFGRPPFPPPPHPFEMHGHRHGHMFGMMGHGPHPMGFPPMGPPPPFDFDERGPPPMEFEGRPHSPRGFHHHGFDPREGGPFGFGGRCRSARGFPGHPMGFPGHPMGFPPHRGGFPEHARHGRGRGFGGRPPHPPPHFFPFEDSASEHSGEEKEEKDDQSSVDSDFEKKANKWFKKHLEARHRYMRSRLPFAFQDESFMPRGAPPTNVYREDDELDSEGYCELLSASESSDTEEAEEPKEI